MSEHDDNEQGSRAGREYLGVTKPHVEGGLQLLMKNKYEEWVRGKRLVR